MSHIYPVLFFGSALFVFLCFKFSRRLFSTWWWKRKLKKNGFHVAWQHYQNCRFCEQPRYGIFKFRILISPSGEKFIKINWNYVKDPKWPGGERPNGLVAVCLRCKEIELSNVSQYFSLDEFLSEKIQTLIKM